MEQNRLTRVLRVLRLILVVTALLFPQIYLDWLLSRGREEVDARVIGVWREALYLLRLAAWPIILTTGFWRHTAGVFVVVYLMADVIRGPVGGVLAWGRHSIDPVRSVLWALINYVELVLGFAGLYLRCDCFNVTLRGVTHAFQRCDRGNRWLWGYVSTLARRAAARDCADRRRISLWHLRPRRTCRSATEGNKEAMTSPNIGVQPTAGGSRDMARRTGFARRG